VKRASGVGLGFSATELELSVWLSSLKDFGVQIVLCRFVGERRREILGGEAWLCFGFGRCLRETRKVGVPLLELGVEFSFCGCKMGLTASVASPSSLEGYRTH
jgi:hypothetical protein